MDKQHSLFELNQQIKKTLQTGLPNNYWVIAEINHFTINRSGHCYLELIEKSNENDKIVAQMNAIIWAYTFRMLRPYFETATGRSLETGMKVLLFVSVEFHEQYGLNLTVKDIEPSFTIGDLEVRRQQIIKKLQEQGVYEMNKELELPRVIQRVAVISSEKAAGYQDFMNQLHENEHDFFFKTTLFDATMQGDHAATSIIKALERIFTQETEFDCVVILRGGGSKSDLSCFDDFDLALNVAQFSLPIICGIGHERDLSIIDMVANTSVKTPTAVASLIVDKALEFLTIIEDITDHILDYCYNRLQGENEILYQANTLLKEVVHKKLSDERVSLTYYRGRLALLSDRIFQKQNVQLAYDSKNLYTLVKNIINKQYNAISVVQRNVQKSFIDKVVVESNKLESLDKQLMLKNPINIMKRGFAIVKTNGKVVFSSSELLAKQEITIQLYDGIKSGIIK